MNTMSTSKALVFEDCSKPQTNLKTIIGTGTGDRFQSACRASVGAISYSALGHGARPFLKTQSQKRYELLILLQRSACLALIPDFVQNHNYIAGDLSGQKSISYQALPPPCTSSLKPSSLGQAPEVKGRSDLNAYLMCPVTWLTPLQTLKLDMLTPKGRNPCRLQNTASSPIIKALNEV